MSNIGIGNGRHNIPEGISGGVIVRHGWRYPQIKLGKYRPGECSDGATVKCAPVSYRNLNGL